MPFQQLNNTSFQNHIPELRRREFIEPIHNRKGLYMMMDTTDKAKQTGKIAEFHTINLLPVDTATVALQEGVTPQGMIGQIGMRQCAMNNYGAFMQFTDELSDYSLDNLVDEYVPIMGIHAADTLERVISNTMAALPSIRYANQKTATNLITTTDTLTPDEVLRMVNRFIALKAPVKTTGVNELEIIEGGKAKTGYYLFVAPEVFGTLQLHPDLKAYTQNNPNAKSLEDNEPYLRLHGVEIRVNDFLPVLTGAGQSGITVYENFFLSRAAMCRMKLTGKGSQRSFFDIMQTALGSSGSEDPLGQRGTIGWKGWQAFLVKYPQWILRYQCAGALT
jgi:N4-gp56 family major capsid protein